MCVCVCVCVCVLRNNPKSAEIHRSSPFTGIEQKIFIRMIKKNIAFIFSQLVFEVLLIFLSSRYICIVWII